MSKILTNTGCPIPPLDRSNNRALFAKPICNSYNEAITLLKNRNLGPGDIAVVRYYLNDNSSWDNPIGMPIRMVMGVGGANAQSDDDIYIFNDSRIDGGNYVTADDVELMLVNFLQNYYTKDEIDKILNGDDAWKTIVNNRLKDIDDDIDLLREKIDNMENVDSSNYYTKSEIDNMFDSIEIPKLDQYYTKNEITEILETTYVTEDTLLSELENKADNSDITDITEILETKVDSSYVENYFETNVENTVNQIIQDKDIPGIVEEEIANQNINQQVSDAVDEKLKDFDGVTTETIDEALQNNEYFTTNVITPITQLETTVKELVDASVKVDNIDGEEMEEWVLE